MMTSMLSRGYRLLNRAIEPAAGDTVRYLRNGDVIGDAVRVANTAAEIEQVIDAETTIIGRQMTMWVHRDDLMLNGQRLTPLRADRIEWIYGGRTHVFEVVPDTDQSEFGEVDIRKDWLPARVKWLRSE